MRKIILCLFLLTSFFVFNGSTTLIKSESDKVVVYMKKYDNRSDSYMRSMRQCPLVYLQDGTLEVHVANFRGLFSVEILDEELFVRDSATRSVDGNFFYVSPATFEEDHLYRVFVTVNGEKYVGEFEM